MSDEQNPNRPLRRKLKRRSIDSAAISEPAKKSERVQSTIQFPYQDLDSAVSVARAMHEAGGVALSRDQLAGVMKLSASGGNFVTKIAAARLFGLVTVSNGNYELTALGFDIVDEQRQRAARADAFLSVPLYFRTFEEFRGKQLPPRPHGLEQAFVRFGVAPKQRSNARLIFDKSATQAGFFANGNDRLVKPIIAGASGAERKSTDAASAAQTAVSGDGAGDGSAFVYGKPKLHAFIQGLLDTLPTPGSEWSIDKRRTWLQAAATSFKLIYKGDGEIRIEAEAKAEDSVKQGDSSAT